jgi:hypothetical protein
MLHVLREMGSLLTICRSRATRSAQDFSRPCGSPLSIAAPTPNPTNQIPINWSEESVAFSVAPIIRATRQGRGDTPLAGAQ